MCIAVIKKNGVKMPNEEVLNICFENNPHGCGYVINRNGKNHLYKGFMKLSELMDSLKITNPLQSENVFIHFRVASVGSIKKSNCHPFIATNQYTKMSVLKAITDLPVVMHNGTFKKLNETEKDVSDTMQFVKIIASILNSKIIDNKSLNDFINLYVKDNNSRLAVMFKNGKINMYGKWIHDEKTKLYFSNESYKEISERFAVNQMEFDF